MKIWEDKNPKFKEALDKNVQQKRADKVDGNRDINPSFSFKVHPNPGPGRGQRRGFGGQRRNGGRKPVP